jgi:hypothetical protein
VAEFPLPDNAAPGSDGAVEWEAWVRIDREKGMDKVERMPVMVRATPAPPDTMPDTEKDGLTLHGIPAQIRAGDAINATLTVSATKDLDAAVALRLHRRCTYVADAINDYWGGDSLLFDLVIGGGRSYVSRNDQVEDLELSSRRKFAAGSPETFDFSLTIPDAGPTTAHPHAQVEWRLEGVLDRRMKDDHDVSAPIVVI